MIVFLNCLLLPFSLDFSILSDGGNGDEWQYKVSYTEYLHQLPFITNHAVAEFWFISSSENEYLIKSTHKTCFFGNITCGR